MGDGARLVMWSGGVIVHAVIVVALFSLVPLPAKAEGGGSLATNVDVGISLCGTAPINYTIIFPASADLSKPHVITFFRTSSEAVSITYEVKDAKGGEVIPCCANSLAATFELSPVASRSRMRNDSCFVQTATFECANAFADSYRQPLELRIERLR